ncbi:hypothetical protein ILUMI_09169 [Ignelater luminosus]|uniref:Uncharacterized protein n=1 Tax=Ignelater luminosus TaxID=2038154 RepID=A0A8K0D4S9_IGNLU|nr:hypothetical protein ILUMI_09169 [Ignelater luminosus]
MFVYKLSKISRRRTRSLPVELNQTQNKVNADSGALELVLQVRKKAQVEEEGIKNLPGCKQIAKKGKESKTTPQKKQVIPGDMEEMKDMMKTMMQEISELKEGQKQYEEKLRGLRLENTKLKEKLSVMKSRIHTMEKEKIRNNLVITGLDVDLEDKAVIKWKYKEQRKKVKEKVAQAKEKAWEYFEIKFKRIVEKTLLFRTVKDIRKCNKEKIQWLEDKAGNLLDKNTKIVARWQEYFMKVLNGREEKAEEIGSGNQENEETEETLMDMVIKMKEVEKAINRLKYRTAAETDNIKAERLKDMSEKFHKIINMAWGKGKIKKIRQQQ